MMNMVKTIATAFIEAYELASQTKRKLQYFE